MANKINRESKKNVIETLAEIKAQPNMNCGIDEIEFPDGTTEKFYYNGEGDRQAAIKFATICVNATSSTPEAKRMMYTCFQLMTKNINPERIVTVGNCEYYLDKKRGKLYNSNGSEVVSLTEDEMKLKLNANAMELILKERLEKELAQREAEIAAEDDDEYDEYDYT